MSRHSVATRIRAALIDHEATRHTTECSWSRCSILRNKLVDATGLKVQTIRLALELNRSPDALINALWPEVML